MHYRRWACSLLVGLGVTAFVGLGQAETIDLLRDVPLEVSGYAAGQQFPTRFQTASEVLNALDSTPVLLLHMEALRRGYHELSETEKAKLLNGLLQRRRANENDLQAGFDHGYAQLVFNRNKTGLFFLRKANDKFQNQFSSLAYGMAEVEADLLLEDATVEQSTPRKLDATFQLADAVRRDVANHQPGFWPSFVRVIEKLQDIPAYRSFSHRDFSMVYVPYGHSVKLLKPDPSASVSNDMQASLTFPLTNAKETLLSNSASTSCDPQDAVSSDSESPQESGSGFLRGGVNEIGGTPVAQHSANFSGKNATIQIFPTEETHVFRVRVFSQTGQPLLSFKSHVASNIVEDLERDGALEIVARQYQYNPLQPVLVYRYTPCGFELDKKIFNQFK